MKTLLFAATPDLSGILISFLVLLVLIAVIAGLIYAIESWVIKQPLPAPVRLVIGLILIILAIIWSLKIFG
jgi:hypothetical protein